ncbi:MAG: glycosyltransferase family 39 protein [Candidatus Synoicihabitans palmerolidicus]|nr:glycosyltransferase family 39 protein [Candidatus Synoicihabitans palmerolidicus]
MNDRPSNSGRVIGETLLLFSLLAAALWLFTWNNEFPSTLHADEGGKVDFILKNRPPDFHHPLLLIQTGRLIQTVTNWPGVEGAARAGRWGSAMAGVLLLLGFYFWVRRPLGAGWALVGTAILAMMPLLAVHAHYVKEDVMLTAAIVAVVVALRCWRENDELWTLMLLGAALGMAAASHYKSVLMLVIMA